MADDNHRPIWHHALTSRGLSIAAALIVDLGLIWLLLFRHDFRPPEGEAAMASIEGYWVRVLAAYAAYAILQIWTLATVTGRGDDFTAALDKFVALSPLGVILVLEAYWIGAASVTAISWRLHVVAILWAAFAITDFFATDITNQRLRSRQIGLGAQVT